MDQAIVRMAKGIAPDLDALYGDIQNLHDDPEVRRKILTALWDNKIGILRVLQAVAAE